VDEGERLRVAEEQRQRQRARSHLGVLAGDEFVVDLGPPLGRHHLTPAREGVAQAAQDVALDFGVVAPRQDGDDAVEGPNFVGGVGADDAQQRDEGKG